MISRLAPFALSVRLSSAEDLSKGEWCVFQQPVKKSISVLSLLLSLLFSPGADRIAESAESKRAPGRSSKIKQQRYDEIVPFQNPRYQKVRRSGKWGCIDSFLPDTEVIPPKYDDISDCNLERSMAKVRLKGKWGYISLMTGRTVIPFKYDDIGAFNDGDLAVKVKRKGKWGYLNIRTGKEFIALKFDEIGDFFSLRHSMNAGERAPEVSRALSKYENVSHDSEGRIAVSAKGKWGFVDETGREMIPLKYDEVLGFSDGLAGVGIRSPGSAKTVLYGFIDLMGNEVVEPRYDEVRALYEGMAPVKKNGKWGFIDSAGKEIVPPHYRTVSFFHEGLAAVCVDALPLATCGLIDTAGNVIVRPDKYIRVEDFHEGMAAVSIFHPQNQPLKTGFIDKTGKEIIPLRFDNAGSFSEGLAPVYRRSLNKWGFIDRTGKVVIPFQYEKVHLPFIRGRARVTVKDKQGMQFTIFIDKPGASPPDSIPAGSAARVRLKDKWGYIDRAGKVVLPVQHDELPANLAGHRFNRFKLKGKYGYLDQKANVVVPARYDDLPEDLFAQKQEVRIVRVSANGKFGYLSRDTGEEIIPVAYDVAPAFGEYAKAPETMKVKRDGKWGSLDLQGREVGAFRHEDDPCAFEKSRGDHYVFGDQVEMKERPDASSPNIAVLAAGTKLEVLGKTDQELAVGDVADQWYEVNYQGKRGYVWGAALADAAEVASLEGREAVVVIRNRTRDTDHSFHRKFELQLIVDGKIVDQVLERKLADHAIKVRSLKYERFDGFSAPLNLLVMTFDGEKFEFADHALSQVYYYIDDGKLAKVLEASLKWVFRGLKGIGTLIMPDKKAGKDAVIFTYEMSQPFLGEKSGERRYFWSWSEKTFLPAQ